MPATLPGNTVFAAGWENGTLLRPTATPKGFNGSSGSPTVVTSHPAGSGYTHAARFEVDNTKYDGYGDRSEVQGSTNEVEGQLRWYRWSFFLPSNFPVLARWQVFGQWHSSANGSPPLAFYSNDGVNFGLDFNLATGSSEPRNIVQYGRRVWTRSMSSMKGQWNEIVMRILWSSSDAAASHRLWFNGVAQTFNGSGGNGQTELFLRNTDPGRSHYYKQGYYRGHTAALNALTVHFAGYQITDGAGGGTVSFGNDPPPPPPDPPPATPGAPPDALANRLGASTASGFYNTSQADSIRGSAFPLLETSKVTGYRVYVRGLGTGSSTQPLRACLYNVANATPTTDTLVSGSLSDVVSVAFNATAAWVEFPITDFDIPAGTYRVCMISGANAVTQYSYTDDAPMAWANDTYADGPASVFAAQAANVTGTDTKGIAAYAIITEASSPGPALSLAGLIAPEVTPDPSGLDGFLRGDLRPVSTSSITRVAQIGQEVISYRRPKFFEIKLDGSVGAEVVWNGGNARFEYRDLQA